MKRILLALGAGLVAVTMASPSSAADLSRPVYKAPVYVAPFSWTGFYVGINGGYGWGTSNWNGVGNTGNPKPKGWLGGGTVGYNIQTGVYVFGVEADLAATSIKDNNNTGTGSCTLTGCETKNTWLGTARARLGYAAGTFLPFITGGAAFGDIKATDVPGPTDSKTKLGWTVGGGVEVAFAGNWSVKAEYLYVDLGKGNCSVATCGVDTDVSFKTNIVRAGLNYRF